MSTPEAFWDEVGKELAKAGYDPTLRGPILRILKVYVLELKARVFAQESHTREEVWAMIRDHIYGHPS